VWSVDLRKNSDYQGRLINTSVVKDSSGHNASKQATFRGHPAASAGLNGG
jgi:hypothetical protein